MKVFFGFFGFLVETFRCVRHQRQFIRLMALGRCHEPDYPPGTWLCFDRTIPARDGDIVLLAEAGRKFAKRIRSTPFGWCACSKNDPPIPADRWPVIGVMTRAHLRPRNPFLEWFADRCLVDEKSREWLTEQMQPAIEYVAQHPPTSRRYEPCAFDAEALTAAREALIA